MREAFIFCLLSALCGAKTLIQTEGGSITATCSFTFSGKGKYVCRDPCENGDVLIETEATEAQKGRYSISYREGTFPASSTVLYVNISQLIQSDSGRYWCGLKRRFMIDSRQEFNVNVTNDMKELEQQQTGISKGFVLPLALCVATLFAAAVLLLYKWKTMRESDGSTSRRQSSSSNNNRRQRSNQFSASKFTNQTPPPDAQQQLYYNL